MTNLRQMKTKLEERVIDFALMCIDISEKLPNNYTCIHLGKQLVRSGTSPAFQYAEACDAESRNDFIHRFKIGVKELKETLVCLKIIKRKPYMKMERVDPVIQECDELIAIFISSIRTARKNNQDRNRQ